jgi:branched-chain amino acid transport system permease protein
LTIKLGLPVWLAMPVSTAITAIIAAILGALVVKKGGLGFVIQTLAFGFIIVLVFGTFDIFGGHVGIVNISYPEPVPIPFLGTVTFTSISKIPFYYLMLVLVFLMILLLIAFYSAWTGRAWRAIGLSAHLAESLGINLFNYRLMAFIIGSAIAGLMGSFYAHYYGALVPGSFGPFKTIYVHAYAILGGINFPILGPVIGAFIMTFIPEFLRFTEGIEPIFTGILIIIIILFMPNGLLGLTNYWKRSKKPLLSDTSSAL